MKIFKKMHLDIKKMKTVSSQALDFGLQIFIDQVSGENENSKNYNFMCSENFLHFVRLRKCEKFFVQTNY